VSPADDGRASLEELAAEYRHLRDAHRQTGVESTARRHLEQRLDELESRIERRLALWVRDEGERERWRQHLHHGAPAPAPQEVPDPLVFRGVSGDGATVEVRVHEGREHRLIVDGAPHGPIPEVPDALPPEGLRVAGMVCRERFTAPRPSLDALRRYVSEGTGEAPWEHAPELLADGLVDPDFGLTPRGRRALAGSRR
jgi:hypothetical protein